MQRLSLRASKWLAFAASVAASFAVAERFTASRGEAFWLLFPIWALAGSRVLDLFPPPRLKMKTRFAKAALPAVLILIPVGLYVSLAMLLGGRISLFEIAVAVYFFAVSLESLLCYAFQSAEWLAGRACGRQGGVRRATATALVKLAVYAVLIPLLLAVFSVHRIKIPAADPPSELGMAWEPVSFRSKGERPLTLRGWFFPRQKSVGTVLACHGVGANRGDILEIVWILHRQAFQVLAFDFRGHGESDGHTVTYGHFEKEDVLGAWDYMCSRSDVDPGRLFALGVSMGGSTMLLALPDLVGVRAAVADSAFADLESMALHQYRFFPKPVAAIFARATAFFGWIETGIRVSGVSPLRALERTHVPLYFIHGAADAIVPPENTLRLHAAYAGPKRLRIQEGAGHGGTASMDPVRYGEEVREFFERS